MTAPDRIYTGAATCGVKGCGNPARWMPVLVHVAAGYRETENTRVPITLTTLGVCDACRDSTAEDLKTNVAPGVRDRVGSAFVRSGMADLRFDRVEWVEIARPA